MKHRVKEEKQQRFDRGQEIRGFEGDERLRGIFDTTHLVIVICFNVWEEVDKYDN